MIHFPSQSSSRFQTHFLILGVTLAVAGVGSWLIYGASAVTPTPPSGKVWQPVFTEDFNGTTLNTSVWKPYFNTYGDGNHELECNTPNNATVSGGTLKITAKRETVSCNGGGTRNFTTAFLGTRETNHYYPRYGYYEMRAKLPHGQGLWPAFWLRHINGAGVAEVDVMEYFHSQVPGKTSSTLHLDGRYNLSHKTQFFENPTSAPAWHTWSVSILPVTTGVQFTFYLDGVAFHSYIDTQHIWANTTNDNLFDIALNMAVGGNWVGRPDDALGYLQDLNLCAQSGTPPNGCSSTGILRAVFPSTYEVDYVHVYQLVNASTADTTPPNVSLTAAPTSVTAGTNVTLSATATDNVSVSKVEYYVDGIPQGTSAAAPYSHTWSTIGVATGTHSLSAKAYDAAGNFATSSAVTVTVNSVATAGLLTVFTPYALNKTTVAIGQTIGGSITYKNTSTTSVTVQTIRLCGRGPGGTNSGSTSYDLTTTTAGPYTIAPGATVTVTGSRTLASTDPTGGWYSYATYKDTAGAWHDGSNIIFTVTSAVSGTGDANGDSRVNALDLSILIAHDGQNYSAADFNHDGIVGAADLAILLGGWTW